MKVVSIEEAVAAIKDRSTMVITGFTGCIVPDYILKGIEDAFVSGGKPNNLTLVWNNSITGGEGLGSDRLAHNGLITKAISAHLNLMPKMQAMVDREEIPCNILPLGCMTQLYREIGRGSPGLITKIGLGTFIDPRIAGGKANSITTDDLVEVMEINGEEYLFYKSFPIDVAVIRGTTIDTHGNLSCEREVALTDGLAAASAVKRSGGIVIAQVENVCAFGSISPRDIYVPGIMIDYAVVSPPEFHPMAMGHAEYIDALAHKHRVELGSLPPLPMNERKIMARRAAMELRAGQIVNLGFGVPEGIASVAAEAGIADKMILTVEVGQVGGVPCGGPLFGASYNSEYCTDMTRMMDWYEGRALDLAFLGAVEVDSCGNTNVTKIGKTIGPGGYINIAQTAKKMCFCGALTAKGLKVEAKDGKLVIESEGKLKKYVPDVEQISFSGKTAIKENQEVLYITERAVFRQTPDGPMLIEIAPGIDLQTQVLDQIAFDIKVSPELKIMDERIFREEAMYLDV